MDIYILVAFTNRNCAVCIMKVGEHFLFLLQELETFASSNAMNDLTYLKGDSLEHSSKSWKPLRSILNLNEVIF